MLENIGSLFLHVIVGIKNKVNISHDIIFFSVALILFTSKDDAVKLLYMRNAHRMFSYAPLVAGLVIEFFMVCWASGTSVAAGILVPML